MELGADGVLMNTAIALAIVGAAAVAPFAASADSIHNRGDFGGTWNRIGPTDVGYRHRYYGNRHYGYRPYGYRSYGYYAPRYRSLPPGLQKKVERGGQLPPGWRKKIQPFPYEIERRLAPMPRDCRRGVVEGHAVIYRTGSERVIDVVVLF